VSIIGGRLQGDQAFADTHPKLSGEDEKLLKETLRDYRRAGLDAPDQRKEVEELRKNFEGGTISRPTSLSPTLGHVQQSDLDGLPESFFRLAGHQNTTTFIRNGECHLAIQYSCRRTPKTKRR